MIIQSSKSKKKRAFKIISDPEASCYDHFVLIDSPIKSPGGGRSKRFKNNGFVVVPSWILNYDAAKALPQSWDNLIQFFKNREYSFDMDIFSRQGPSIIKNKIDIEYELEQKGFGRPTLVMFFGAMNTSHIKTINNCYEELKSHFGLQIMCITANANYEIASAFKFSIISDNKGYLARFFGCLDPLGGGAFPLDKIILVDQFGRVRAEANVDTDYLKLPKRDRDLNSFNNEETIVNLVECLQYLKKSM